MRSTSSGSGMRASSPGGCPPAAGRAILTGRGELRAHHPHAAARGTSSFLVPVTDSRGGPSRSRSREQRPRIEALDRDDADARQGDGEGADVVLEVVELESGEGEVGQSAAQELAEAEHADPPARLAEERSDLR